MGAKATQLAMNTGDSTATLLSFTSERKTEVPQQTGDMSRVDKGTGDVKSTSVDKPKVKPLGNAVKGPAVQCELVTAGGIETARLKSGAALDDACWSFIEATAETNAYVLCGVIRPRTVTTVSGIGAPDEGDYLVWSVSHQITPAEHSMSVTLRRNATKDK